MTGLRRPCRMQIPTMRADLALNRWSREPETRGCREENVGGGGHAKNTSLGKSRYFSHSALKS